MQYRFVPSSILENPSFSTKKQQIFCFIEEFCHKIKIIEEMLLDYLDQNEEQDLNYQLLINKINEIKFCQTKTDLKLFFHLIVQISNNHYRSHDFFTKIYKFLTEYKNKMTQYFSNYELFNIFKSNMQILLFLFKSKTILPDQSICNIILSTKYRDKNYPNYFFEEIKSFLDQKLYQKYCHEDLNDFTRKREIGENDSLICEYIRKDAVIDFISYVNLKNYPLNSNINESIYETNEFLIDKTPSLIEYASFYGSIQIFRYLINNNVQMTPSLWLYAIHGRNPDIIHLLEENHINPKDISFKECLIESIKCHHNEIAGYIEDNLLTANKTFLKLLPKYLKYYNFTDISMIRNENFDDYLLYSCKYDYIQIFDFLCKTIEFDPTPKIISQSKYKFKQDSLLNIIVKKGNIEILQTLLAFNKVDVNDKYIKTKKKYIEKEIYQQNYETIIETTVEKTPLIIAVEKGNLEIVKLLAYSPKIDINAHFLFKKEEYDFFNNISEDSRKKHQENRNALIIATENNLLDIFNFLISQKIDPRYPFTQNDSLFRGYYNDGRCELTGYYEEKEEKNILIIASEKGNTNIIQKLLSIESIDINSKYIKLTTFNGTEKDYEEKSALIIAIEDENVEIVRLLLSKKETNVNAIQIKKICSESSVIESNALIIASMTKNPDMVQLLLSRNDIDVNFKYTIKSPIDKKMANSTIIKYKVDVIVEKTALFTAVELECEKIVQLLLLKPETNTNSKLINIQSKTYIDKNKYYSMQTEYKSEFIAAIEKRNLTIIQLFLQRKDVDVNFISTLLSDANIYRYSTSEFWKSESYLKFEKKKEEKTALHIATQNSDIKIIQSLLANSKIDVNIRYICNKEQTYIFQKKVKNKTYEKAALHFAIGNQNLEITRLLLSMEEIDVNTVFFKNSNFYKSPIIKTPIMIAVEKGETSIINLFLSTKNVKISDDLKKRIIIDK